MFISDRYSHQLCDGMTHLTGSGRVAPETTPIAFFFEFFGFFRDGLTFDTFWVFGNGARGHWCGRKRLLRELRRRDALTERNARRDWGDERAPLPARPFPNHVRCLQFFIESNVAMAVFYSFCGVCVNIP